MSAISLNILVFGYKIKMQKISIYREKPGDITLYSFQTIQMTISNRYVKLKFKVLYKEIAFAIL